MEDPFFERKKTHPRDRKTSLAILFPKNPKTVEDSFREVYYDGYDFVIAAIKKDLISLTNVCCYAGCFANVLQWQRYSANYESQYKRWHVICINLQRGLDISKLVPQSKLSPSLFKLKDNNTRAP